MKKLIRFFVPFIVAFLFLGMLFWLVGASSRAVADPAPSAPEGSILVTTLEDELNSDGDCSLREAITAANTNTAVDYCTAGDAVITDTITFEVSGTSTVNSQLSVTAGGPLVIDGEENIIISGGGSLRIFYVNISADLILDRLTLSEGFSGQGGGIYNQGTLVVSNSTLSSNYANADGGGIYNDFGVLAVHESNILGNDATNGGGIYNSLGTLTILRSIISGNSASSYGAGIYNWGSMSITDSTLSGNDAYTAGGGGILNTGYGTLAITNSTISNNSAQEGGGVSNWGTLIITNSTLSDNTANYRGGIQNGGTLTITQSTLSGNSAIQGGAIGNSGTMSIINITLVSNTAQDYGGGMINSGVMDIVNSTLSENTAGINGGGINTWSELHIINSTISGNSAAGNGGGIYNQSLLTIVNSTLSNNSANYGGNTHSSGMLTFTNSIVANSLSGGDCAGTIIDGSHNISSDDTCGFDPANGSMPNTDPLLSPLQDNGGPTLTHALAWDSPAIDAGDDAQCTPTDQRGALRPQDGNGDGLAVCDIGSYEFELGYLVVTTLEDELNTDDDCSLREAIAAANTNSEVDDCGTGDVLTDTIIFSVEGTITVTSQLSVTAGGSVEIYGSNSITISGDNSVHILFIDVGAVLTLDSLRIVDGYGSDYGGIYNLGSLVIKNNWMIGNRSDYVGGSINNGNSGILTIISSTLSNNSAIAGAAIFNSGMAIITESAVLSNTSEDGGAILNISTFIIANSILSGNIAENYDGGAIANTGILTITSSTLSNNTARYGGSIQNNTNLSGCCIVTIKNSILSNNYSVYDGGAIQNYGVLEIIDSTLYSNTSGLKGGGIYNHFYGKLDITNSAFIENSSNSTGGGISSGGALTITHSIFTGNSTVWYGGGISTGGTMTLANSTLSDNNAVHFGGGIDNGGMLTITYSTLSGSSAMSGGGIFNAPGYGVATLDNSIVAYSPTGGNCAGSSITDNGHNIEDADTCGFNPANGSMPNTDPLLGPLQDNGGPTWTHALAWNSPAIDAGDDAQCPATDQRGVLRPLDGDNDGVEVCDIGSYEREYQPVAPALVVISGASEGDLGQVTYFTATVEPVSTTLLIEYVWRASGYPPIINTRGLTDTVGWAWEIPGAYAITVTADNLVGSVTGTHAIIIIDVPISGLVAMNDSPTVLGGATTLSATVTSGSNITYSWNFGDGEIGEGAIATHTYSDVGVYTATVTASNSANTLNADTYVIITEPSNKFYLPLVTKSSAEPVGYLFLLFLPGSDVRVVRSP